MRRLIVMAVLVSLAVPSSLVAQKKVSEPFVPRHRVQGVGHDKENVAAIVLDIRTSLDVRAQWFWIMKRPEARPCQTDF